MKGSEKDSRQGSVVSSQAEFRKELVALRQSNLLRKLTCIEESSGSRISINGQSYINFSSNDYLNLSAHPRIVKTAIAALKQYGFGSGASRLLSGTYYPHQELERCIAKFKGTQSAILFNAGYAANTGVIPAICGSDSLIFSDELNHATIIDGIRLSKSKAMVYKHRDVNHLESLVKKTLKNKNIKRRLVVTDTVFSMDGDIAPLNDIHSLCKKDNLLLMTDDAHATGVIGETGRGGLEYFNLKPDGVIQMGTLSKALGCFGAYIAGDKDLIDYLVNKSRSFIYSTSLPPAMAAAAITAIDILEHNSVRMRKRLWKNREVFLKGLSDMGFDTMGSETPVIPILIGDAKKTLQISTYLYDNKIFAPAIRPPTVAEGKCRIRFSVTAGHKKEDIDKTLEMLRKF